jgi:LRP1 type putative zinc finger protein
MGLRNIANECNCREDPNVIKVNNVPQSKCPSSDCSNNSKRDCVNGLCGRCCKRSGLWCDVHVNLFPTRYQTVRAHDLVKPRVNLAAKEDLDCFLETKEDARAVCFGPGFSVTDDDVIKVLDLCKNILLLELGIFHTYSILP